MESRQVIKLEVRQRQIRASADPAASEADDLQVEARGAEAPRVAVPDHHELDELLLCEARRASDALLKASAALHAASSVVLDAVAALREERGNR